MASIYNSDDRSVIPLEDSYIIPDNLYAEFSILVDADAPRHEFDEFIARHNLSPISEGLNAIHELADRILNS